VALNFRGAQKFVPLMSSAWQPSQHIFCADNGKGEGFHGAIDGGDKQQPSWFYQRTTGCHE